MSHASLTHPTSGVLASGLVSHLPGGDATLSALAFLEQHYTVTTELRTYTFQITPPDPPFLGQARRVAQVVRLARKLIPRDAREHFGMFFLNNNLDVLGYHELAIGTLDRILLSPREVYGAALRVLGTASIILVHNHPSGNPEPSRHDVGLTKRIAKAGKLLDVPLNDHVILGSGTAAWTSFAERGML